MSERKAQALTEQMRRAQEKSLRLETNLQKVKQSLDQQNRRASSAARYDEYDEDDDDDDGLLRVDVENGDDADYHRRMMEEICGSAEEEEDGVAIEEELPSEGLRAQLMALSNGESLLNSLCEEAKKMRDSLEQKRKEVRRVVEETSALARQHPASLDGVSVQEKRLHFARQCAQWCELLEKEEKEWYAMSQQRSIVASETLKVLRNAAQQPLPSSPLDPMLLTAALRIADTSQIFIEVFSGHKRFSSFLLNDGAYALLMIDAGQTTANSAAVPLFAVLVRIDRLFLLPVVH
jgi:hypothetical protein